MEGIGAKTIVEKVLNHRKSMDQAQEKETFEKIKESEP